MANPDEKLTPRRSAAAQQNPGDEAPAGTPQTAEALCAECSGSGQRDGNVYQSCGGSGRVVAIVGDA